MATKIFIVPDKRSKTSIIKESTGGFQWNNAVMTGRWHKGDENGNTQYEYATLKAVDENGDPVDATIEITDIQWSEKFSESSGVGFIADSGRVIVGRTHGSDEEGMTMYATAVIKVNGVAAQTVDSIQSQLIKESAGIWYNTDGMRFITGRVHKGDENDNTCYISSKVKVFTPKPGPRLTKIVPDTRATSLTYKESNSNFLCPANAVITGMYRDKDENGSTLFEYATLKAISSSGKEVDGEITVEDIRWEKVEKESDGFGYDAPIDRVIVGRKHFGDENEPTWYASGVVKFNGYQAYIKTYSVSEIQNLGVWFKCDDTHIMTARHHYGDENGLSYYGLGVMYCDKRPVGSSLLPFDLIVALHEDEEYFPMDADDYIVLSRFRRHIDGGTDMGYDKNLNKFVSGNDKTPNYYNIPAKTINSYVSEVEHQRLYNLRPHDGMSLHDKEVFLQPFTKLCGDTNPNKRVPAYVNILNYTNEIGEDIEYIDFWLFFGYDFASFGSHQGDWEHVMVKLVNKKIAGAWLSHHSNFTYFKASDLDIAEVGGRPRLKVFCAKGSHAMYATTGLHKTDFIIEIDHLISDNASDKGYRWKVSDNRIYLRNQPWKNFAGAWGEVGLWGVTTGPLGPWYKKLDYWCETPISLSSIASENDIIIVPDEIGLSDFIVESANIVCEAPQNKVFIGRRHTGDENGETIYMYASLKAIDYLGQLVDGDIKVIDCKWSDWTSEVNVHYTAPDGYVIVGRQHSGDEKSGRTRYKIGRVTFNGKATTVKNMNSVYEYQMYPENKGVFFQTNKYFLWIGRDHIKDENGTTSNAQGLVKVVL